MPAIVAMATHRRTQSHRRSRIDPLTSKVASVDFFAFKPGAYELAMAHLYDHPTKSFLEVRCPTTCVFVLPDQTNPQR
jgi:hypothetical protein